MTSHSIDNMPEDYTEYDEDDIYAYRLEQLINELNTSLNSVDRFQECPLCQAPLTCIENKGLSQRFICQNGHMFSTNETLLNN